MFRCETSITYGLIQTQLAPAILASGFLSLLVARLHLDQDIPSLGVRLGGIVEASQPSGRRQRRQVHPTQVQMQHQ
jgi:hypothetical protein